ncbi:hypothetical protein G4Z16_15040 [Streptomyces bathyalis]|uniref:Uncharacterized protein n=1 Tax=Streptomyces bathyalis TaxID=2710756 RepID=A0A7T1WSF6_9ACTN|nr:hypothetical protein [Streptomyces bathyalis]QPP07481.1 hypothetical protein G4Z16_15040 [Streptomyces bathyalis]
MAEQFVDITDEEFGPESRMDTLRRWFSGPPRWLFGTVTGVNAVLTLVVNSVPDGFFLLWLLTYKVWLGLVLAFAARLALTLATDGGLRGVLRDWARWAAVPAVATVAVVLVSTGAPLRAGLHLAKPTMTEFATDRDAREPAWIGPYPVERAERLDGGGARFLIKYAGFLDGSGFVYNPGGPPPRIGEDFYEHLHGPWYAWDESW